MTIENVKVVSVDENRVVFLALINNEPMVFTKDIDYDGFIMRDETLEYESLYELVDETLDYQREQAAYL